MSARKNDDGFWRQIGSFKVKIDRNLLAGEDELGLSVRERQVMEHLSRGLTTSEIAGQMGVSASTVDTFKRRCFEKLGVKSTASAVALIAAYFAGGQIRRVDGAPAVTHGRTARNLRSAA